MKRLIKIPSFPSWKRLTKDLITSNFFLWLAELLSPNMYANYYSTSVGNAIDRKFLILVWRDKAEARKVHMISWKEIFERKDYSTCIVWV